MYVGEYLRKTRTERSLSIRRLAEDIEVHPSYVSRVERGKCRASRELLARVAGRLQVSEPHLLSLAGYMPKEWREPLAAEGLPEIAGIANCVREVPLAYGGLKTRLTNGGLQDPLFHFFPPGFVLSTELNEVYELRLAKLEASLLKQNELIERGAYFLAVDGQPTNHFKICTGGAVELPKEAGARLQSFLGTHRFKSSYATHGLFPYRGKFHPQMIKAIINVMGVKPGEIILDPMAGSGTTAVEASLMGIDSLAVDVSPFCVFMTQAKLAGLIEDLSGIEAVLESRRGMEQLFHEFSTESGKQKIRDRGYESKKYTRGCLDILGLAYMDARGFSARSSRSSHQGFFTEVLTKYVRTIQRFQEAWRKIDLDLGRGRAIYGDARNLPIDDNSVDGVVFSPPYSFAIDYLENDLPHLEYLGVDIDDLKRNLIGLRGHSNGNRALQYFEDMEFVLKETVRVLRPLRYCTIIVGSNSNQLSRALKLNPDSPEARYGIETRLVELAEQYGLFLELPIRRLIVGMANTMREEHILFLRKGN